jgi:hypothetical protein
VAPVAQLPWIDGDVAVQKVIKLAKDRRASRESGSPPVTFRHPLMRACLPPFLSEGLYGILANSGHAKTVMFSDLMTYQIEQIMERELFGEECVIVNSHEHSIEQTIMDFANRFGAKVYYADVASGTVDLSRLTRELSNTASGLPVILIGNSQTSDYITKGTEDLLGIGVEAVRDVALAVKAAGIKPRIIGCDYLQAFRQPENIRADNRTVGIETITLQLDVLSKKIGCPVFPPMQAKQGVAETASKMPEFYDCFGSSEPPKKYEGFLAQMRPLKFWERDTFVKKSKDEGVGNIIDPCSPYIREVANGAPYDRNKTAEVGILSNVNIPVKPSTVIQRITKWRECRHLEECLMVWELDDLGRLTVPDWLISRSPHWKEFLRLPRLEGYQYPKQSIVDRISETMEAPTDE